MKKSEKKIFSYLIDLGFIVNEFSKKEMRIDGNNTPDFKVLSNNQLQFYCEVKEINEDKREFKEGTEKDNTYNIVSDCIHEAYKQFISVNPEHKLPNVLAIYSIRHGIDILDYKFTVEGGYSTEQGDFLPWLKNVSNGRIKDEKGFIDTCIWYDELKDAFSLLYNRDSKFFENMKILFQKV